MTAEAVSGSSFGWEGWMDMLERMGEAGLLLLRGVCRMIPFLDRAFSRVMNVYAGMQQDGRFVSDGL